MAWEGYVDAADAGQIRGWVWDPAAPDERVAVAVEADGQVIATVTADGPRADLAAAGKGDGAHAFSFSRPADPSPRPLVARVGDWLVPLGSFLDPSRYAGKFAHPIDRGPPAVATGFTPVPAEADDPPVVARLVAAYHRAVADAPVSSAAPDLWSAMAAGPHREITGLLARRDVPAVARYLADAHAHGLTDGITQGRTVTGTLRVRADARARVAAPFVDALLSLAEFLGVADVPCPDQAGAWGDAVYADPQLWVDAVGATLGVPVVVPPVIGSSFGLATRDGIVSGRDLLALHSAVRLRQLGADVPRPDVCEIGGGLGAAAYYSARLGVGRYTIVDLPVVGLLQGYFLARALGPARVRLYGEPVDGRADVWLVPPHQFSRDTAVYDLLLNQDSLPEMHRDVGVAYLRRAAGRVRHAFLSVNQEARAAQAGDARQTVVRDLAAEAGGWRPVSRNRHWLRPGYVEEVYRPAGGTPAAEA